MSAQTIYLILFILSTLAILAGLGLVVFGMIKKKVKLIALGVLLALCPTIIKWMSSLFM